MEDLSEYIPKHESGKRELQGLFFNNPSNLAKKLYYYPLWGGEYYVEYPYRVDRKYMNSFILFWIEEGSLTFKFDQESEFTASEDSLVLLDCKRRNVYFAKKFCRFIFFHFNGCQVQQLYDYISRYSENCFKIVPKLKVLCTRLLNSLKVGRQAKQETLNSKLLYEILLMITDISNEYCIDQSILHVTPHIVNEVLEYINKHFSEKITIKSLCEKFNISQTALSQQFKLYTNNNIHKYLTSVRLTHAQKLLTCNSELSISEIAIQCGFNDASHLNKVFEANLKMTPGKFRENFI